MNTRQGGFLSGSSRTSHCPAHLHSFPVVPVPTLPLTGGRELPERFLIAEALCSVSLSPLCFGEQRGVGQHVAAALACASLGGSRTASSRSAPLLHLPAPATACARRWGAGEHAAGSRPHNGGGCRGCLQRAKSVSSSTAGWVWRRQAQTGRSWRRSRTGIDGTEPRAGQEAPAPGCGSVLQHRDPPPCAVCRGEVQMSPWVQDTRRGPLAGGPCVSFQRPGCAGRGGSPR